MQRGFAYPAGLRCHGIEFAEKERSIMSIITVPNPAETLFEAAESRRAGLLRRVLAAIMESRRLAAERRVASYFEGLSDARLADLGWSAAEIASIRVRAPSNDRRGPASPRLRPTMDGTGAAPIVRSVRSWLSAAVQTYFVWAAEQRRLRRAERELESLDDRLLKDIGITRTDIGRVVRYGRGM